MNPQTCEYHVFQEKTVVEQVEGSGRADQPCQCQDGRFQIQDRRYRECRDPVKEFGRIATQNAKNVILQKIREEGAKVLYNQYYSMEKDVVTGVVQRYIGRNVSVNLGKVDAILTENEQVRGEVFQPTGAHQGLYPGGEGYVQGTEDSRVKNPSGAGKAPVSSLK